MRSSRSAGRCVGDGRGVERRHTRVDRRHRRAPGPPRRYLTDADPPLTNSNLTFQSGYDPSYYDPRARFVYGSIRYVYK